MIKAFRVASRNLPEALEIMNKSSDWFRPEVVNVISNQEPCIVLVNMNSEYPYIENEWVQRFCV